MLAQLRQFASNAHYYLRYEASYKIMFVVLNIYSLDSGYAHFDLGAKHCASDSQSLETTPCV